MTDREQLEAAIAAQERLRGTVPDDVVDLAVASLRDRLDSDPTTPPRRRHATVLFADVEGFTGLAELVDAEVVGDLMNEIWALVDDVIVGHGGRIDKHIGDAVMAVWGAESTSENDPEQAVRAGLQLQQLVTNENERTGRDVRLRVGITTGPVLLGRVGTTGEFTAMGDTVNVAARLEAAAPPGGVLVTHETYRHVRGLFDVTPAGTLHVRGRDRPLNTYVVVRAKPQSFRIRAGGVEGVETRLVGRDRELATLREAFAAVIEQRTSRALTFVGEAGIGKSRLLHEFESWVELLPTPVFYLRARALPTRTNAPFGLIRDLLTARFEIRDTDPPPIVAERLAQGFAGHLTADDAAAVGRWLGFDVPSSSASSAWTASVGASTVGRAHVSQYILSVAAQDPVLIVLEDLHWADDESLELLEFVFERGAGSPTLFLAAARPSFLERRPGWLHGRPGASRVTLAALTDAATRELVDDILQVLGVIPAAIAELVAERADGNPFFVEELVKMLIDDGVIVTGGPGETWRVDQTRFDETTVPATLTGVLEARLDALSEHERDALQRASVVGRLFWAGAVRSLSSHRTADQTDEALQGARRRELIFPSERPSLGVSEEYLFKHALLRDVTYETVLLRDRKRLHLLVADWLQANAGERIGEVLELMGEHRALGDDPVAAAELFDEAARRALAAGRSTSARRLARRAIALWEHASSHAPASTFVILADASCRSGEFDEAEEAIGQARLRPMTPVSEADAAYLEGWIAAERGDRDREREVLTRGLPIAESVGGTALVHVLMGLSWLETGAGATDLAEQHARRALGLCEAGDHLGELGRCLNVLGAALTLRDDIDGADACAARSLSVAQSIGDLELEARSRGNLGVSAHLRGDATGDVDHYEAAAGHYREQARLLSMLALDGLLAHTYLNLAQVSLRLGLANDAAGYLDRVLTARDRHRTSSEMLFLVIVAADLMLGVGDVDEGLRLLGAVRRDPAARETDRQEIERVLERAGLAPARVDAGMAVGATHGLREIVDELVMGAVRRVGASPTPGLTPTSPPASRRAGGASR